MAQHFTVQIPVSPYIERFITSIYGQTIAINNNTTIGSFLIGVLQKRYIDHKMTPVFLQQRMSFFTAKVTCIAPLHMMEEFGYILRPDQVVAINRHYEKVFEEHLYFYVQNRIKKEGRYKGTRQAIEQFAEDYKLPVYESITMDCLIKMEYRFRKKLQELSSPDLSAPKQSALQLA